jgi:hypothetical protein
LASRGRHACRQEKQGRIVIRPYRQWAGKAVSSEGKEARQKKNEKRYPNKIAGIVPANRD